jgi:hypothetical protein
MPKVTCAIDGCDDAPISGSTLCQAHYDEAMQSIHKNVTLKTCAHPGCEKHAVTGGNYCWDHSE